MRQAEVAVKRGNFFLKLGEAFRIRAYLVTYVQGQRTRNEFSHLFHVFSFMPRVVTAGVPMRMPEGFMGEPVSNGMAFLFTVMPTRSRASCASAPLMPLLRRSTMNTWLSVPLETTRKPSSAILAAMALAFLTTWAA